MKPNKIHMVSGFSKPKEPDSFSVSTSKESERQEKRDEAKAVGVLNITLVYRNPDNDCYDFFGNLFEDPWDVVDTFIRSDFIRGYAPFMSATMRFDSWQFTVTKEMVKENG